MIAYLLRQGFVRVAFVPTMMGALIYVLFMLAAPRDQNDDDDAQGHAA